MAVWGCMPLCCVSPGAYTRVLFMCCFSPGGYFSVARVVLVGSSDMIFYFLCHFNIAPFWFSDSLWMSLCASSWRMSLPYLTGCCREDEPCSSTCIKKASKSFMCHRTIHSDSWVCLHCCKDSYSEVLPSRTCSNLQRPSFWFWLLVTISYSCKVPNYNGKDLMWLESHIQTGILSCDSPASSSV